MTNKESEPQLKEMTDFENVFDIKIEKALSDKEADLEVVIDDNDSQIDIESKVREQLLRDNWWLRDYWQNKGMPQEQINVKVGREKDGDGFELYNFGEKISDDNKNILQEVAKTFSRFSIFQDKIKYILVDNQQFINPYTGEEKKGNGAQDDKAITIYPNALKPLPYRVEAVSNFEGTVIHEFAHSLCGNFIEQWKRQFGWEMLDEPKETTGGAFINYATKYGTERCVNDYATNSPEEDFCESIVAFLKNPKILDKEKADFIKDNVFSEIESQGDKEQFLFETKTINEVRLPKIKQPVKYTTQKINIKIIR